ncbi:chromate transporter [Pseudomonas aeruginosa]|nr:chromate transporter [Pseudomonas aeruginosa]
MNETAMQATEQDKVENIGLLEAFLFWLKLGFISFGGPAGQISIMHQELVERRRWISERRFLHALNYCMLLPGPEAQQLATYIGWLMHRTWGGVIAGVLFVLPSLFILIALSWVYIAFGEVPVVAGLFYGIKPAVTAIVVQAAHRIGSRALKNNWLWAIAAASFVAIFALNIPFPLIVLGAAMIGYLGGRYAAGQVQRRWWAWGIQTVLWAGIDRRQHATAGACALPLVALGSVGRCRSCAVGLADGATDRPVWLGGHPDSNGLVLHPRLLYSPSAAPMRYCRMSIRAR